MKFKYHPEGYILRDGKVIQFNDFIAANQEFPIIEGEHFEYKENGDFEIIINFQGTPTHIKRDPLGFKDLIQAINNLGE